MLNRLFRRCAQLGRSLVRALRQRLAIATRPAAQGVAVGALTDLVHSRPALVAENAFLRQQLLVLRRSVKRPRCTPSDRASSIERRAPSPSRPSGSTTCGPARPPTCGRTTRSTSG